MPLEAIKYESGKMKVLNQLLLPQKTEYADVLSVEDGWECIKTMKVRGAPAISIVAALSLAVELNKKSFESKEEIHDFIINKLSYLATSRPTAVNLSQVVKMLHEVSQKFLNMDFVSPNMMKTSFIEETEKLLNSDLQINKKIGEFGGKDILKRSQAPVTILTHCNTGSLATAGYGTALGVIRWLHENDYLLQAYCTETRPYNQGARLTAYELVHDKIPATLVCDSMVAYLMKSKKISAVVVGADRVVTNGDTANKIGTYQIALCAKYHGIPFYVACPRSSFDFNLQSGDEIPIEERPHHEMTMINSVPVAAEGVNCWNPAFDVTPSELITGGIITEIGVYSISDLRNCVEKLSEINLLL